MRTILLLIFLFTLLACQKQQIDLAGVEEPANQPEYTVNPDLNPQN